MDDKKILVVEDHPDLVAIIRQQLAEIGYPKSCCASTGPDTLEKIQQERPDLILMDMGLPGINGPDIARGLKADPQTRSIPILAITASASPEDRELCQDSGCDAYLSKPFPIRELKSEIEKLLTDH